MKRRILKMWMKSMLMATGYCILLTVAVQTQSASSPLYQCPAQLQLGPHPHSLKKATIFDGPIEEGASLVPDLISDGPQSPFWQYQAYERTLYVKCIYEDTDHFIVLEAQGAKQCTHRATVLAVSVQCE